MHEKIIDALISNSLLAPESRARALELALEFSENEDILGFTTADVRRKALEKVAIEHEDVDCWSELGISDDDAQAVIDHMVENLNAEIGINWSVIEATIDILWEEGKISLNSGYAVATPIENREELKLKIHGTFLDKDEATKCAASVSESAHIYLQVINRDDSDLESNYLIFDYTKID